MQYKNCITLKGITIWLVCALFFMYECLLRTVLGTFQPSLMAELHLNAITFALLSSTAYSLMFGPMQFMIGHIIERFGIKKTMFFAVMICALATTGFACSSHYSSAVLFRVFMGLGSSFGFICLLAAVYDWMPRQNIALFIGLSQLIGTLGPMLASGPLSTLSTGFNISWREVFGCFAVIGFILAILVILIVDKNKKNQTKVILRPRLMTTTPIRTLLRERQVWYIAVFSASVFFSLEYLSENECKIFLKYKGFSDYFSSYMITVAWLGYAAGCVVQGFISDKIHRRKSLMLVSALSVLIGVTGAVYLPLNEFFSSLCFILLGIGASGQSIGFVIMAEQCKEIFITRALGLNNAMIVIFIAVLPPFIGFLLRHVGASFPPLVTYHYAFLVLIGLSVSAVILAGFLIEETYCKSMRENTQLNWVRFSGK